MTATHQTRCTAFAGFRQIDSGELSQVARKAKDFFDRDDGPPVLIFDDTTSEVIEIDFRGSAKDVQNRLLAGTPPPPGEETPRGPGRPRLGVVAREVTLLPRHWDWLNSQPGGASVALRKLVEEARRVNKTKDRVRQSQEAAYRFMSALAGNLPGFEEAARALFAGNPARFDEMIAPWPPDVRAYAKKLAANAFSEETT